MLRNFRYWLLIFTVCLSSGVSSCASATPATVGDTAVRNWKMSVITSEDSSWAKGANLFSSLVKQRTGGKIKIDVYPNGALAGGDQVKELNMLREGSINFTYHSNLLYTNLDPAFAIISMPWLFTGYSQIDEALGGPAGDKLLKMVENYGITGLAYGENGFRQLTNNKLAIHTPADLKGLKIRIPGVDFYTSIFKALDAEPIKMNFGQVVDAIKKGEIDGQENPIDVIISSRLYEVQSHITLWNYSYDAIILGINKKDWDSLTQSDKDVIKQAAKEASQEQIRLSRESAHQQESLLRSRGMTVTELTSQEIDAFRVKMAPVYLMWAPTVGESLMYQFQKP